MPIHMPAIDRRRFLAGAAAGAACSITRRLPADPVRAASDTWLLWADTHIAENLSEVNNGVNMAEHFRKAADEVIALDGQPGGLLIDGDCAYQHGEAGDYRTLVELLDPLRKAGIDVHLGLGNHDHRLRFWDALPDKRATESKVPEKHVSVISSTHVNWFLLDSLDATDVTPGKLGREQLAWLAAELDAHPDQPAIVFGHHHPMWTPVGAGLTDTVALWDVLAPRKQVKAYIFGHTHRWRVDDRDGLHLVNLPPVAYPFAPDDPQGWVLAQLRPDGVDLELRSLDPAHPKHGEKVRLDWRVG